MNSKKLKVVKKTEISYNFVQIGLKMCKLALPKKLNSVLELKTGISDSYMSYMPIELTWLNGKPNPLLR